MQHSFFWYNVTNNFQLHWTDGTLPRWCQYPGHHEARPQPPDHDQHGHHVRCQGPGQHPDKQEDCCYHRPPSSLCFHRLCLCAEVSLFGRSKKKSTYSYHPHLKFSILTDESRWNEEGLFKNFIAHAAFTMFAFPVEFYLAFRFFISRTGTLNSILKRLIVVHNIICVSLNFLWQAGYCIQLFYLGHLGANLYLFMLLFVAWSWEEYVVMIYLLGV